VVEVRQFQYGPDRKFPVSALIAAIYLFVHMEIVRYILLVQVAVIS